VIGTPPTVAELASGTIESPCPPSTIACTSLDAQPSSMPMKAAEARGVERARHPHYALARLSGDLHRDVRRHVEGVGDHDEDRIRRDRH
jgi:hypothetical protein